MVSSSTVPECYVSNPGLDAHGQKSPVGVLVCLHLAMGHCLGYCSPVWGPSVQEPGASEASIRNLPPSGVGQDSGFDAAALLDTHRGLTLTAIVEQVRGTAGTISAPWIWVTDQERMQQWECLHCLACSAPQTQSKQSALVLGRRDGMACFPFFLCPAFMPQVDT